MGQVCMRIILGGVFIFHRKDAKDAKEKIIFMFFAETPKNIKFHPPAAE